MARQKNATARRGRPPKNAAAPKKRGRPRKARDSADGLNFASPFLAMTAAQEAAGTRHQALYMALETRKLTQGVAVDVGALIEDAEKIRKYLSEGIPEADPVPAADPNVGPIGSGGMTLAPRRDEDESGEGDTVGSLMRGAQ